MITAAAFVIPALWLLDLSLRKRWLILVHTRGGKRKILFKKETDERAIRDFLAEARSKLGY